LKSQVTVHIPGLGDFTPDNVNALEDPCPLPQKERVLRRSLNEKEKLIYAPFSGVGGIVYDHDAVYIDLGGSHSHGKSIANDEKEESESAPLVRELREMKSTLDEKLESAGLQLFSHSDVIKAGDVVESDNESEEDEDENLNFDEDEENDGSEQSEREGIERPEGYFPTKKSDVSIDDSEDSDEGEEEDQERIPKTDIDSQKKARFQEASDLFYSRFRHRPLQKMIYDDMDDFMNLESRANFDVANCANAVQNADEDEDDNYQNLFVGGDFAESAKAMLDHDDKEEDFGDFEELDNDDDEENEDVDEMDEKKPEELDKREAMKKKLKEKFDMEYDEGDKSKDFYSDWKSEVEEQAKVS
jgi:ribosome biogenesis protein BMS1